MNSPDVERRLRRWAEAKALPPAYVQKCLTLDEPSQKGLLQIAESLKMHTGQFIAALTLLEEIAIREGRQVDEILAYPSVRRVLNSAGSGPGRARILLDELRTLRYPRLKRAGQRLAEEVSAIKLPPGIKIALPRDLASDEVRVEIAARTSTEMKQLLECLTAKSGEIVRLVAMLDGADGGGLEVE